jgi:GNAT superfamily N-acetyltransferase
MEAAIGPVFAVDVQLVRDGTYFVVEDGNRVVGCGGWSRRSALFGGGHGRSSEDSSLDPRRDPARVRAFFVDPAWARMGIGRSLMEASERAMRAAAFQSAVIVSTLAGEPLYAAFGYRVSEYYETPIGSGMALPVVRMAKSLSVAPQAP